jgi:competence CoiA-like predicted nuclease
MIWAERKGERIKAQPRLKGKCSYCGEELIPKCGTIKVWHWAHKADADCDSWYEPETIWHIEWKNNFPEDWHEVIVEKEEKKHIADIKTSDGKVIEFQNSPICIKDIRDREFFYGDMVWVINGWTIGKNIEFKNKRTIIWKWMPTIAKETTKPLFIDIGGGKLLKINAWWYFRNRTYCNITKYAKEQFLLLYGGIIK